MSDKSGVASFVTKTIFHGMRLNTGVNVSTAERSKAASPVDVRQ
ncbi:hypothetical protein AAFG07_31545 [Bradyrhizobium sp. B097]